MKPTKQIRVEMPAAEMDALRALCEQRGVSVVEAMRRGAFLFCAAHDAVTKPHPKRGRPPKNRKETAKPS